jgi:pimeloyl-ACP methyl ester carboxylesterase
VTVRRWRFIAAALAAALLLGWRLAVTLLPGAGAGALLHPARRTQVGARPAACRDVAVTSDGLQLKGWQCQAATVRRGSIVYLHGIADNRSSASGVMERFTRRGFDTAAYDSRAHGESDGDTCTYGFFEKQDLHRILDTAGPGPIVLIGASLGGAVALQEAARDSRVTAIVAAETFSDLRTVAVERAPVFFTPGITERAFRVAEQQGRFSVDDVSPLASAAEITIPVLLIHGADDSDTPPDHSRRILGALKGPKRLILVPGARHNQSLTRDVWDDVERWVDEVIFPR